MGFNLIKLDNWTLDARFGTSITSQAKFSLGVLAGINLKFRVHDDETISQIEDVFKRQEIEVDDPYVGRVYKATIKKTSWSYQEGYPERSYTAEVRELDMPPNVTYLEVNGHQYTVIKYSEKVDTDNEISRDAVLKVSDVEFRRFWSLAEEATVKIRRVDVDAMPIEYELERLYWSLHEHDGEVFRKLKVGFRPVGENIRNAFSILGILFNARPNNLERELLVLAARYERLIEMLVEKQVFTQTEKENLLAQDWTNNNERIEELKIKFQRVDDAEDLIE